jgi:penicillin amidase
MRIFSFLLALLLTVGVIVFGSWHQPLGQAVPPVGKLINPFTGFWQNAVSASDEQSAEVDLPGLSAPVQVAYDDRMVPHLFAETIHDAYLVQGYLTAKDRLWQMDISTRSAGGRLAEVMGPRLLNRDKLQRRKGMLFAAENALRAWEASPLESAKLEAYVTGVNAWINQLDVADYPLEFKLLNYEPEPWTKLHCALFFKNMAEALCARHSDIPATNARAILGDSLFQFLYPERIPGQSPVIPASVVYDFEAVEVGGATGAPPGDLSEALPYQTFPLSDPSTGSNNWAVSGDKTASGYPILANDPHLGLTLPAIWYELQIHTPELNSYGVSLPGIPGIIIGFNKDMAWGVTNVGHDVLDWYRMEWVDEEKTRYRLDGQEEEVERIVERIKVRGQDDVLDTVKYTVWGPVVYETEGHAYQDLAMRWLAHDMPDEKPFFELTMYEKLMGGKGYTDYREALKSYETPAQNFIFASRDNDIAITVNGKFPIKDPQQGRMVQEGNTRANSWKGFIPRDQVPQVRNPERGFVASANQHSTAPDYPYYYNGGFDEYRGRYINRRLENMDAITVEDMKALQLDNYSLAAEEGTPIFLTFLDSIAKSPPEQEMYEALKAWDYRFELEAKAPIIFRRMLQEVYRQTFDEIYALRDSIDILYPEEWRLMAMLRDHPGHSLFDIQETPEKETASEVVTQVFQKIASELADQWEDPGFHWAKFKNTRINHLGFIPALGAYGLMVGGYKDAPNSIKDAHGPSWRMIVAFEEDGVEAYGIYPGGQSGNAGSYFYDNAIDPWVAGDYFPLFLMESPDDEQAPLLFKQTFK